MKAIKKLFKKRTPKPVVGLGDLETKGFTTVGTKLPYNEMGAKQLPSSKLYTNL